MGERATCDHTPALVAPAPTAGVKQDDAQRPGIVGVHLGVEKIEAGGASPHREPLDLRGLPRGLSAGG